MQVAERMTPGLAGTNPGTGTANLPTALTAVGPYALPVPGLVPGQRRWAESSKVDEGYLAHKKQLTLHHPPQGGEG